MIEMWLDPEIRLSESQPALTDAQVRGMIDRHVLRHVTIDRAAAILMAMRPQKEEKEK